MQWGFSFEASRCTGCMACMVACMDQNDISGDETSYRHVTQMETENYPSAHIAFFSIACMHCAEAPCLSVCPSQAIFRDPLTGIVDINPEACFGCHSCALVCPFGAPRFHAGGKMSKCNLCAERVAFNMEPACVRTCPTKALGFGPMETQARQKASGASIKILESLVASCSNGS